MVCIGEAVGRQFEAQLVGQLGEAVLGSHARGQDEHVEGLGHQALGLGIVFQRDALAARAGKDGVRPGPDEAHAFVLRVVVEALVALARGPDVDVEDGGFAFVGLGRLQEHDRLFHGVHAADVGAVAMIDAVDVPGADAEQPGDFSGRGEVGHALQDALERPGRRDETLVLQTCNDIRQVSVSKILKPRGVDAAEARRQHHSADLDGHDALDVVEVDGPGGADLVAGPADAPLEPQTVLGVDDVLQGHGLVEHDVRGRS